MKTLKEQIKVMQAYADGKTIKKTLKYNGAIANFSRKEELPQAVFNWSTYDYDIVEEPTVRFVVFDSQNDNIVCTYSSYEYAKRRLESYWRGGYKIIKLVQDMDFKGDEQ